MPYDVVKLGAWCCDQGLWLFVQEVCDSNPGPAKSNTVWSTVRHR